MSGNQAELSVFSDILPVCRMDTPLNLLRLRPGIPLACTIDRPHRREKGAEKMKPYVLTYDRATTTIRPAKSGWIIEYDSIVQGAPAGLRLLLPYAIIARNLSLDGMVNDHGLTRAQWIEHYALEAWRVGSRNVRVLRKGHVVR